MVGDAGKKNSTDAKLHDHGDDELCLDHYFRDDCRMGCPTLSSMSPANSLTSTEASGVRESLEGVTEKYWR